MTHLLRNYGKAMNTQFRWVIWTVLLVAPLLAGCGEVLNEYYLSNHTDEAKTVRMTPLFLDTVDLKAGPLIAEISGSVRASLEEPVAFEERGEAIEFTLPAQTTVYLGFSSGGTELFRQLEVSSPGRRFFVNASNYREYFSVRDNLVGAVVHVLDIR